MDRYICVHAHFYQPPRENPWLESIELQDSAYPYHDWNERITSECYAPNMASRILDETGRIIEMVNIYGRISFNFGPTLLSWLEEQANPVYRAIQDADRKSLERFSGHGSALAQVYNHMIMPLANERDRLTQVRWGIEDFRHRFARDPEGMWLAETAVDVPTLETLAAEGIRFTILAPHQAARIRPPETKTWKEVGDAQIDPTRAYTINLPSGRSMALFFYDGPISRAIAFEKLLNRGEDFAQRLLGGFSEKRDRPQLVNIATDGETYGHHHRFGDMGLSYALHYIETRNLARLTNYGEFLEKYPPKHEVEIIEDTSWSCAHGIERWRSDCSCSSGGHSDWNQAWREPLRDSLDWLRDRLAPDWEEGTRKVLRDPWAARDDYISVILGRNEPERVNKLLEKYGAGGIEGEARVRCLKLLELQRHAQLMYTSCGWFFDDLSGIETVQILQYAGRVLQLASEVLDLDLESEFLDRLAIARSNLPEQGDGRKVFESTVKPARVNLNQVAAHYAMTSLFNAYGERDRVYSYQVEQEDFQAQEAGKARLVVGCARFVSQITGRSARICFGVLHLGDHNLTCGVREFPDRSVYDGAVRELFEAFSRADFPETIRRLDRCFDPATYSLKSLFRDEQRKFLDTVLVATLDDAEADFRRLYETNAPLMRFLKESNVPLPKALFVTAEYVFNLSLRQAFTAEDYSRETVESLLEEARREGIPLDHATLEYAFRRSLEDKVRRFHDNPESIDDLMCVRAGADLLSILPFEVNLWTVQNLFYVVLESCYPGIQGRAAKGDAEARKWVDEFVAAGAALKVRVQ